MKSSLPAPEASGAVLPPKGDSLRTFIILNYLPMKRPFNPPTVKHDISVRPRMVPDENGNLVEKGCIVNISGPGLPGIHYPYEDVSLPSILQLQNLNDLFAMEPEAPVKLWGDYWQSGQLYLLTGDMGVGKSTLAISLGRAIAEGHPFLDQRNSSSQHPSLSRYLSGPSPKVEGLEKINTPSPRDSYRDRGTPTDATVSTVSPTLGGEFTDLEMTHPVTLLACHPSQEGINPDDKCRDAGAKVLFVGFELGARDMMMRYGGGEVSGNFVYANLNADAFGEGRANVGERLVKSLDKMVEETEASVLIIDQPDRMYLQPAMWNYFMLKLNELKVLRGLSILLTLNNKPRNLSKAPTISSMYRSNLLAPHADSIVCIANHCRAEGKRYLKQLKNTGGPMVQNTHLEVVEIGLQKTTTDDECQGAQKAQIILQPPTILSVQACGFEREEKVLLPTATERRNRRMIEAEEMRRQGMGFREIADRMELPERTVRSWVGFIKEEIESENENEREINTPSPLRGTPTDATVSTVSPTLGGEFTDLEMTSPLVSGVTFPSERGTLLTHINIPLLESPDSYREDSRLREDGRGQYRQESRLKPC